MTERMKYVGTESTPVRRGTSDHREEPELVRQMLAGDETAMEQFADRYFPPLYRFAMSRLAEDPELVREIVQTTVCKALKKLETFRGEAGLLTWLCACCRNEIAMHFRRRKRRSRELELDEGAAAVLDVPDLASEAGPERRMIRKETAHLVHLALDHLPSHYAQALEWKYVDRLSVNEIAGRLEMGPKAAESLLTRARSAFRNDYERLIRAGASGALAAVARGVPLS